MKLDFIITLLIIMDKFFMRFEKIKKIRAKLRNHQVNIGTWQQIPHASISEILVC